VSLYVSSAMWVDEYLALIVLCVVKYTANNRKQAHVKTSHM